MTVPNIGHVVDCGFVNLPYFDATNGFERLITCPISRASAKQRAGMLQNVCKQRPFILFITIFLTNNLFIPSKHPNGYNF